MFLKKKSGNTNKNSLQVLADEELIRSYQASGDTLYVGELYTRYTHLVYGVCMKYFKEEEASKDAVMQLFESLHLKLLEFKIENFKSWIHTVSKNHCLMALRKIKTERKHHQEIYKDSKASIMESDAIFHPTESMQREEKLTLLEKAIEQLKVEQKTCIELLYLQQKSYQEVAHITGYDIKKVKSYIQNGRRNLKIILESQ